LPLSRGGAETVSNQLAASAPLVGCSGLLGRHFDRGVKIDRAEVATRRHCPVTGAGHRESVFAQATHVDLDGPLDSAKR
jgi:hypothetical protein